MFFPFKDYQVFDYGDASENTRTFVIGPLYSNAIVFCEFYDDNNGSRMQVFYEFGTRKQYIGTYNLFDSTAISGADLGWSNFVPAGATIYESSSDDSTGRTRLRLHILYLP